MDTFTITSSAFEQNATIPSKFTCDGQQVNPPLTISDVPEKAKSLKRWNGGLPQKYFSKRIRKVFETAG